MQPYSPVSHSTILDDTPAWFLALEHKNLDASKQITHRVRPKWNPSSKTGDFFISVGPLLEHFLGSHIGGKTTTK